MKHPLVNPSLTPHGFGAGNTYKRSSWKSNDHIFNGDWGAARYWETANLLNAGTGNRPAERIVHEIMPSLRTIGRTDQGDFEFDGKPYQVHDLAVMSRIAVWLGANCGGAMLRNHLWNIHYTTTNEFRVRWNEYEKPQRKGYLLRHLLHACSEHTCDWGRRRDCYRFYSDPSERDELVLEAFLLWLGTAHGRAYLDGLKQFLTTTEKNVYEGFRQRDTPEKRKQRILASLS